MELFKVIVDTLASVASIIAIVSVLVSWYRSARKPLVVESLVIHQKQQETTFILRVRNVKDYPVEIKRIDCYRRKKYTVQKKTGQKPEYFEGLPLAERIFTAENAWCVAANGHTDIRVPLNSEVEIPPKILFFMETSHGFHELWCSDLTIVPIGKVEVYDLEYKYNPTSRAHAKARYWFMVVKELPKTSIRWIRRG